VIVTPGRPPITRKTMARIARFGLPGAALVVVAFFYRYLSFTDFANDHFVHLSMAQQIGFGALPVRDFVERGLPLMTLVSAAGQSILGDGLRAEVIVIASAYAASAAMAYAAAIRLSGSVLVAAAVTLVPVLVFPVSYSYPKLLTVALGFLSGWIYTVKPSGSRAAVLAVSIIVAFLFRHDLGIIQAIGVVALMIGYHGISRDALFGVCRVAGVSLVMLSPYMVWVQIYEGVPTYVKDGTAFWTREAQRANWWEVSTFEIDPSRPFFERLGHGPVVNVRWKAGTSDEEIVKAEDRHRIIRGDPNSPMSWQYELMRWSATDLEQLVKDPLVADTHHIDRSRFILQVPAPRGPMAWLVHLYGPADGLRLQANAFVALFYLVWILPIAAAGALAFTWHDASPGTRGLVAMTIIVQVVMSASMLRDPLTTRIRDVLVPASLLMAYLAGLAWPLDSARAQSRASLGASAGIRRALVSVVLVVVVAAAAAAGEASTRAQRMGVYEGAAGLRARMRTIRRTLSPPDQYTGKRSAAYGPLIDYLTTCTSPNARLLTLTFAPEVFFYAHRAFAGGQVSLTPGYFVDDRNVGLMLERIAKQDVPLVLMDSETRQEMMQYRRLGSYVEARYHEIGRFPVGPGKEFILLAENDRASITRFGVQQLPCFA
jgi:hypothetical protein